MNKDSLPDYTLHETPQWGIQTVPFYTLWLACVQQCRYVPKFRLGCHIWVLSYFNVRWSHSESSFRKTIIYDPTPSGQQKILTNICEIILRYRMRNVYKISIRNSKGNRTFWIPRHRRLWYLMKQGADWIIWLGTEASGGVLLLVSYSTLLAVGRHRIVWWEDWIRTNGNNFKSCGLLEALFRICLECPSKTTTFNK